LPGLISTGMAIGIPMTTTWAIPMAE